MRKKKAWIHRTRQYIGSFRTLKKTDRYKEKKQSDRHKQQRQTDRRRGGKEEVEQKGVISRATVAEGKCSETVTAPLALSKIYS